MTHSFYGHCEQGDLVVEANQLTHKQTSLLCVISVAELVVLYEDVIVVRLFLRLAGGLEVVVS
jgi:hypothetical protein